VYRDDAGSSSVLQLLGETFPDEGVELTRLLVVSDLGRSRDWYEHVRSAGQSRRRVSLSGCRALLAARWSDPQETAPAPPRATRPATQEHMARDLAGFIARRRIGV
jgi:hypothetical protein